jgi:hypothetical protein
MSVARAIRLERNVASEFYAGRVPEFVEVIEAGIERGLGAARKSHQHDAIGIDPRMVRQDR